MRILYVGPLYYGGTCLQRKKTMQEILGHEVISIDTEPEKVQKIQEGYLYRILRKLFGPIDIAGENKQIISAINASGSRSYNVVWIDKGITIKARTLKQIKKLSPETVLAHYNPDDPFGAIRSGWKTFLRAAPFYDVHFVPRDENLDEYRSLGCENVVRFYFSYDKTIHRPMEITEAERLKYGGPVGFIGDYEKERAESIKFLADNGVIVRIWGPNWGKTKSHPNMIIEGKCVLNDDYAKAICAFDINLCFLRKVNRDRYTVRSMEIPATGSFMLAERTDEHMALFKEGKEAAYFSSNQELLEKVQYYLEHADERHAIAASGYKRCISSKYSSYEIIMGMLDTIGQLRDKRM